MPFQCFSQRLWNPYRGITSSIRYQSAEAVTAEGVKLDIYAIDGGLPEGLPPDGKTLVNDIRSGSRTEKTGLQRGHCTRQITHSP